MEIREHVVSSGWAPGCVVGQTYGTSYQRKMEITGGLGLVQSPAQSPCVCAVPGRGACCSRTLPRHGQCWEPALSFPSPGSGDFAGAAPRLLGPWQQRVVSRSRGQLLALPAALALPGPASAILVRNGRSQGTSSDR